MTNASENNITNCNFFAGNCDDYITSLVHKAKENSDNFLAVIDPPRAGLREYYNLTFSHYCSLLYNFICR